jgi:hypothetical protein
LFDDGINRLKLGLGWTGPFKALRNLTDVTYEIQKTPKGKPFIVNVDHLKPYEGILPPVPISSVFITSIAFSFVLFLKPLQERY